MFISTENTCVIKPSKSFGTSLSDDTGLISTCTGTYQYNLICGSPKHEDIYDCKFSFLERAYTETATSQNFQRLKQKYLPLLRQKIHKTSGFGIFTSRLISKIAIVLLQ